jgi:lysophospholipase L1-like esterase
MAHRIAVIGQSNAILAHGFVNQLAERAEIELGNVARLGASPSAIVPLFGRIDFFEGHDFAIFDTAIVDQNFLWADAVDLHAIARWLEQGIIAAQAAGCLPILLSIPHGAILPGPGEPIWAPPLQRLYRSVAARNGAACFDLYDAAARGIARDPANRALLYADPDHLSEGFVRETVGHLLSFMNAFHDAAPPTRRVAKAYTRFDPVPLATVPGARIVPLASALLADDFAEIGEGEELVLPVGPTPRIVAALIDRASSEGMLEIGGNIAIAKQIGTTPDSTHSFVAQLVPILTELHDAGGLVSLRAVAPATPPTEPSWHPRAAARSSIRIARLLVERAPEIIEVEEPILPLNLRGTDWFQLF